MANELTFLVLEFLESLHAVRPFFGQHSLCSTSVVLFAHQSHLASLLCWKRIDDLLHDVFIASRKHENIVSHRGT